MDIKELLQQTIDKNASDLHLLLGYYPHVRINNELYALKTFDVLDKNTITNLILSLISADQKDILLTNKELDLSYEYNNFRFRVNIYFVKNDLAASFRLIPSEIKTIEDLSLPKIMHDFTNYHQGLVLITGPTGEGKSTTLAAIINEINISRAKHIITIEDPIEFVYPQAKSIISQRELHQDTHSFSLALRSALREDPDVVLLGEMRDYDTIQAALTIAETGHLVFSSLHTKSSPEAIDRIVDVFPSAQQNQVRHQLSSVLIAVVSQRLIPDITKKIRYPATEILINNSAVSSIIREGKTYLLNNVIETSQDQGMVLFEKDLLRLYSSGLITKDDALSYAFRPQEIRKFIS